MWACNCIGPQNGESRCPCLMRNETPMTKSFFFYGIYDGDKGEDTWKALHEHFEKLARENDDAVTEATITDRKAKSKR